MVGQPAATLHLSLETSTASSLESYSRSGERLVCCESKVLSVISIPLPWLSCRRLIDSPVEETQLALWPGLVPQLVLQYG